MANSFRVAAFNVENLFSRARVFNKEDKSIGDEILDAIDELNLLLRKRNYTSVVKRKILKIYKEDVFDGKKMSYYIKVREDRGKLFERIGFQITGIRASGTDSWDGAIVHKVASFNEVARKNTAKVINSVNSDIACIVEAENRPSLNNFNSALLGTRKFNYSMVIDGNDNRGIDVGLLSKFPITNIITHIYDGTSRSRIFSRDCLEITVELPNGEELIILCNHLKSKGYGAQATSNARRKKQSDQIVEILKRYKLSQDNVIVAGDLNDTPNSNPLSSLMNKRLLYDVLELQFDDDMSERWTYHYRRTEQIDYILISKPLKDKFIRAGVERRGIHNVEQFSNGTVTQFDTVTSWKNQASDHGAVWADFNL